MWHRLKALYPWLTEGYTVWITIAVVLMAFGLAYVLPGDLEIRIRNWGLVLQVMGILSVAFGVKETLEFFGRPRVTDRLRAWWGRRPGRDNVIDLDTVHMKMRAFPPRIYQRYAVKADAPLEERVAVLEKSVQSVLDQIEETHEELDKETNARESAIEAERKAREESDQQLYKRHEAVSLGGLYLQLMGTVWLVVGVTVATIPHELAGLWVTLWR